VQAFSQSLGLLFLDKVLFAGVGALVALVIAKRLEYEKRWHATVLELAKARAAALLRALAQLGELDRMYLKLEYEFRTKNPDQKWLAQAQLEFVQLWRKAESEMGADTLLLGDTLTGVVSEYLTVLHRMSRHVAAGFDTTRDMARIRRCRILLDATLPPFEHPSSSRRLEKNLAAWKRETEALAPVLPEAPIDHSDLAEISRHQPPRGSIGAP